MTELIESKAVDFGKTSGDYAQFRPGFPRRFYERLGDVLARGKGTDAFNGMSVFDVATGPGVIAIELAALGCAHVVGVDIAENQIAAARERAERAGVADKCRFAVATAEATEQKDSSFDLITAGQCWHWFDHKRAIPELWRILKPGGRLVIAHFDYLPSRSEIAAATEQLVLKYNPTWGMANMDGLYPQQAGQLLGVGAGGAGVRWEMEELFVFDHAQPFTRQVGKGRGGGAS